MGVTGILARGLQDVERQRRQLVGGVLKTYVFNTP